MNDSSDSNTAAERELIRKARAGDPEAMERLLVAVAPRVRRFGRQLCGTEADDALQDTLLTIAHKLDDFRGDGSLSSWAYAIVRSACRRRTRGLKNAPTLPLDAIAESRASGPDPEQVTLTRERARKLQRGLAALNEELREAVILRDVDGLSTEEAADAAGITVSALKSRLHRGRAALARELERRGPPRPGCPDVLQAVSLEREGELSTVDCKELERHVSGCEQCNDACHQLRAVLGECRQLGAEASLDPELAERVRAAYRAWLDSSR